MTTWRTDVRKYGCISRHLVIEFNYANKSSREGECMNRFLEILNAVAGHDNEVLVCTVTPNHCSVMTVSLKRVIYNEQEGVLRLFSECNGESADLKYGNIIDVSRGDEDLDDSPDYTLHFSGGYAAFKFELI